MTHKPTLTCILLLFFCSFLGISQENKASILGAVFNIQEEPLQGITIQLEGTSKGVATDIQGNFEFLNLSQEAYTIIVSGMGYKTQRMGVTLSPGQELKVQFFLDENTLDIDEVVITGKSNATKIKETGFAVNAIETEKFENVTTDAIQILSQTSGIRVRESGGLGSGYNLSLNGLSDRQIRIFVDEIPVDQLGSSFNLNNLSVNLIDRIDVYKGVVPIGLGADALGGAINISTDKKIGSFLDASYSIGSFNTHRASLDSKYRFSKSGFTISTSGFYNYSDNNYTMEDMPVFINGEEESIDIERFHDMYRSYMGRMNVGFTDVNWADELTAGISIAQVDRDIQSGVYGTAVGEAREEEKNTTFTTKYSKSGLFNNKFDVKLFLLYNEVNSVSIDTSSNRYDWSGKIIRTENNNLGELVRDKTIFEFDQSHFMYRVNGTYRFNESHKLILNHIHSNIERQGENRLNVNENEPFRSPNTLNKSVTGASYEVNLLDQEWINEVALKYYNFDILTRNARQFADGSFEIEDITTLQQNIGYYAISRYFITPNWYAKASFERGYRLPQPNEIFGDGLRILANPELEPESSYNLNLGMSYRFTSGKSDYRNEINLFQRDVENFIFIRQEGVFSTYRNVLNVMIRGIEWDFNYQYSRYFTLNGNVTWQNVLNNEKYISGTNTISSVYRDRMPNTPYLFANLNANMAVENVLDGIDMSIYYSVNYIHEFYLNYESISQRNTKNKIPTQFLNHLGFTLSSKERKYNLSFEARNIFDEEAYDNFRLQKPGRAFYLKLRYFIK